MIKYLLNTNFAMNSLLHMRATASHVLVSSHQQRRCVAVSAVTKKVEKVPAKEPKKAEKKAGKKADEDRIKRAPSAYNLFYKSEYADAKAAAPAGTKTTEVMADMVAKWKKLSDADKTPYVNEAQALQSEVAAKREAAKAEAKKNAPPLSPYPAYVSQHYAEFKKKNPDSESADVFKMIAANWKEVPESEKAAIKAKYVVQLAEWKAKQPQKA